MNDVQRFITWYLSKRARMSRGMFNAVLFLALLPVAYLQFGQMKQQAESVHNHTQSLLSGLQNGRGDLLTQTDTLLRDMESASTIIQVDLNSGLIEAVIFILLIPLFLMRLRDIGFWAPRPQAVMMALIYITPLSSLFIKYGVTLVPEGISLFVSIASFVVTGWVCTKGTERRERDVF